MFNWVWRILIFIDTLLANTILFICKLLVVVDKRLDTRKKESGRLREDAVAIARKRVRVADLNQRNTQQRIQQSGVLAKPRSAKPILAKPRSAKPILAKPILAKPIVVVTEDIDSVKPSQLEEYQLEEFPRLSAVTPQIPTIGGLSTPLGLAKTVQPKQPKVSVVALATVPVQLEEITNCVDFKAFFIAHTELLYEVQQRYGYYYQDYLVRSDGARNPLHQHADLLMYMACYGYSHYLSFYQTLEASQGLASYLVQHSDVTVIDYGCGQGIATIVFIDWLLSQIAMPHINIILIEPSLIALERAKYLVKNHARLKKIRVTIKTANNVFDELPDQIFKGVFTQEVIHLFSNTLDLIHQGCFDPKQLVAKMQLKTAKHYVVGCSPMTERTVATQQSLNIFLGLIDQKAIKQAKQERVDNCLFYKFTNNTLALSAREIYRIDAAWRSYV
jgi:SAM-dependent methyltransferase